MQTCRVHIVCRVYTQWNSADSYTSREQLLVPPWSSKIEETFSASDSPLPPLWMDSVWKHPLSPLLTRYTPRKNTMAHRVGDVQFEGERTLDRNVASSRDTTESSVSKVLSCKQVACKKPLLVTERTESFHLALSTLSPSSFRLVSFFFLFYISLFLFSSPYTYILARNLFIHSICSLRCISFLSLSLSHSFIIYADPRITCLVVKLNKYSLNNSNLSKWSIG